MIASLRRCQFSIRHTDFAGGGRCPFGFVCWWRLRIDLEQKLGTTAEGFREGPFALPGEVAEFAEEFLGDLSLGHGHAGDRPVPSNLCQ